MHFHDRTEAGILLAKKLEKYKGKDTVIYALPRGGVVLGAEISKHLNEPLDLIIPRKVGHPGNPEYAVCAVTEDGHVICDEHEVSRLDPEWLKTEIQKEVAEAKRRREKYLSNRPNVQVADKIAIIADDGIATGLTMQAAIHEVKDRKPAKIVVAIPVIPSDVAKQLEKEVDEIVALDLPRFYMGSVGSYYDKFDQVEDEEVIKMLGNLRNSKTSAG